MPATAHAHGPTDSEQPCRPTGGPGRATGAAARKPPPRNREEGGGGRGGDSAPPAARQDARAERAGRHHLASPVRTPGDCEVQDDAAMSRRTRTRRRKLPCRTTPLPRSRSRGPTLCGGVAGGSSPMPRRTVRDRRRGRGRESQGRPDRRGPRDRDRTNPHARVAWPGVERITTGRLAGPGPAHHRERSPSRWPHGARRRAGRGPPRRRSPRARAGADRRSPIN